MLLTVQLTYIHTLLNSRENLIKQESVLLSMFHNTTLNYMILSPDINDLDSNPYSIDGSILVDFKYGVGVDFGELEGSDELETLVITETLSIFSISVFF